jgi:hypothetical protein
MRTLPSGDHVQDECVARLLGETMAGRQADVHRCSARDTSDRVHIAMGNGRSTSPPPPVSILFEKISYAIDERTYARWRTTPLPCCDSTSHKQILSNVSGVFPPGLNAILGNESRSVLGARASRSVGLFVCQGPPGAANRLSWTS